MGILNDMPESGQLYFQDGATILHDELIYLHDYIMFYLLIMLMIVTYSIGILIYKYNSRTISLVDYDHNGEVEIFWTVIPVIILFALAIPSFKILFTLDSNFTCVLAIKAIGSQWYWTYEITDYFGERFPTAFKTTFESYMVPVSDLNFGDLRLMETDNVLVVPIRKLIRLLTTSTDVIHSWSVPSFAIKLDAIPGRLNQTSMCIVNKGLYYGSCQEICGINHAFMPIQIVATDYGRYINYLFSNQ